MDKGKFIQDIIPERFVEVDAARLLLIINKFSREPDNQMSALRCLPKHPYIKYFTPEYYLHKIDFLLRYPGYLIYELSELYRLGKIHETDRAEVISLIRYMVQNNEPELHTTPFRKFWRGAYERLDEVEAWWYGRRLIYTGLEARTNLRPQKYYFISELGEREAQRLIEEVPHGQWYSERINLIHRFFGTLTPAEIKNLQYSHAAYRQAQLDEYIPDLTTNDIVSNFKSVFNEELELTNE